jgi:hypothetical protein
MSLQTVESDVSSITADFVAAKPAVDAIIALITPFLPAPLQLEFKLAMATIGALETVVPQLEAVFSTLTGAVATAQSSVSALTPSVAPTSTPSPAPVASASVTKAVAQVTEATQAVAAVEAIAAATKAA